MPLPGYLGRIGSGISAGIEIVQKVQIDGGTHQVDLSALPLTQQPLVWGLVQAIVRLCQPYAGESAVATGPESTH